jgi:hypothetical protein
MDIKKIKDLVNSDDPYEDIEFKIIRCLAEDDKVIPILLNILNQERELKKEVSQEMNMLLSKAHIGLDEPQLNKDNFIQKEIIDFYKTYKTVIGHCFKNINLK